MRSEERPDSLFSIAKICKQEVCLIMQSRVIGGFNRLTCQSEERADVAKFEAISKRLDGPVNGRKDHNQVADSVPCSTRHQRQVRSRRHNPVYDI